MGRDRLVYETTISTYQRDGLLKAVEAARFKAVKRWGEAPLGHAYRIDDVSYSVCSDPDSDYYTTSTGLEIAAFPVVKETDCGFRIRIGGWDAKPETRFINTSWTKQWAARTPEAAVRSFVARRRKMASIYTARAKDATFWADEAERLLEKYVVPA